MQQRLGRPSRTVLSLPNTGQTPTWTGMTTSGQTIHSVVPIPNRTVQLHFIGQEGEFTPLRRSFRDNFFQQLATFWYEYPMRHYAIQIDDLNAENEIISPQNIHRLPVQPQNGNVLPRIRPSNRPPNHAITSLRISHPPTIGREFLLSCPEIGNHMALHCLQVTEVSYTHHLSTSIDTLVIKFTVEFAHEEFDGEHTRHYIPNQSFPNFNPNLPMLLRDHYRLDINSEHLGLDLHVYTYPYL